MAKPGDYRFRLRSTGDSSARYGRCEVCNAHCSEVFIQTTQRAYAADENDPVNPEEPGIFWSYYGGKNAHQFGHERCLLRARPNTPTTANV